VIDIKLIYGHSGIFSDVEVVPLAGIEPALLAESDFESDASTSSAIGARDNANGADIERVTL
jgi:hypothetical protein